MVQATQPSGISQYVTAIATAWPKTIVATRRVPRQRASNLLGEYRKETRRISSLDEARDTPYYLPSASLLPISEIGPSFNAAWSLVENAYTPVFMPPIPSPPAPWRLNIAPPPPSFFAYQPPVTPAYTPVQTPQVLPTQLPTSAPFLLSTTISEVVSLQESWNELPATTYTAAINSLELPARYSSWNLERGFSSVVDRSPSVVPSRQLETQQFDLEVAVSMFSPSYFGSLIPKPGNETRFITDLLICVADEDVDLEVLDFIVPFWKEVCQEILEALSDPEKLGQAIAEWVVQHPLETNLGFLLWLIKLLQRRISQSRSKKKASESWLTRLLRKFLPPEDTRFGKSQLARSLRKQIPQEDPRAGRASKIVEDFGSVLSAILDCLETAKMRLTELSQCAEISRERIGPLLGYLKATGFISQNTGRFYSLSAG